jgi:sporulation protein YlmC with PRC-barrel domain
MNPGWFPARPWWPWQEEKQMNKEVQMKGKRMIKSKKMNATLIAAAVCVASAGWTGVQGQEASTDQPLVQQASPTTTEPVQAQIKSRCSQLIGTKVINQQGERLGRIADVVVSFDSEHVSYCVLKVKPGRIAKARLVEVPLAAFQPSADGSSLILNASKANLANATGFDPNQWPSGINTAWGAEPPPPVELPPAEVYAPPTRQPPISVGSRAVGDNSYDWDQYPAPRTASQAIDQMHSAMIYGLPLSSH